MSNAISATTGLYVVYRQFVRCHERNVIPPQWPRRAPAPLGSSHRRVAIRSRPADQETNTTAAARAYRGSSMVDRPEKIRPGDRGGQREPGAVADHHDRRCRGRTGAAQVDRERTWRCSTASRRAPPAASPPGSAHHRHDLGGGRTARPQRGEQQGRRSPRQSRTSVSTTVRERNETLGETGRESRRSAPRPSRHQAFTPKSKRTTGRDQARAASSACATRGHRPAPPRPASAPAPSCRGAVAPSATPTHGRSRSIIARSDRGRACRDIDPTPAGAPRASDGAAPTAPAARPTTTAPRPNDQQDQQCQDPGPPAAALRVERPRAGSARWGFGPGTA